MNRENKLSQFIFITLIIVYGLISCNTTEPPPGDKPALMLTLEDLSCTEAWIQLTTNNLQLPATINLLKDNNITKTINLQTADTLLYLDSLLPNQTYNFHSVIQSINQSSNEVTVTTLDTTSHNFTWEVFTFGNDIYSSILFDVAIIGEEIWAVGDIKIADGSINGYSMYNAVHWDGSQWDLKKITVEFRGNFIVPTLQGVFAFSSTDIWFIGSLPIHGDGESWVMYDLRTTVDPNLSLLKAWGTSSNEMYFVGSNGSIAHYHNGQWSRIESGTTLALTDIDGNENGNIYTCGGNLSTGEGIVLKINSNNTVTKVIDSYYYGSGFDSTKMFTENLYGPLRGIWAAESGTIYTVGNFIYRFNNDRWDYAKGIENNYLGAGEFTGRGFSRDIAGKQKNDFIFVGERNTLRYFNGIRAVQIGEPFSYTSEYHWSGIEYKQNTAVAVGRKGGYAAVMVFKK